MARTLADQLAIEQTGPGQFISKVPPDRMGNAQPIAYGGCTAGIATRAACATVPGSYSLYSLVGHFLGPASITEKLACTVHSTRDTKTFVTRRVVVSQKRPDGQFRTCLELIADFHVEEPALLAYSAPPTIPFKGPDESPTAKDLAREAVSRGLASKDIIEKHGVMFSMMENFFETRTCAEGLTGQNVLGLLRTQPTDQDSLPLTERTSGDWAKTKEVLTSAGEKAAVLSFLMDGGLSFLPLWHEHLWFDSASACSTLDFALRLFTPDVDLSNWHLRERKTIAGGFGRTYSESRLWDEQRNLVACMTQQCILRPKPQDKVKAVLTVLLFAISVNVASITRWAAPIAHPHEPHAFYCLLNANFMSSFSIFPALALQSLSPGLRCKRIRLFLWFLVIIFALTVEVLYRYVYWIYF
ncbi:hypothetical protein diail_4817 [Diaporthe ilicicola]|nr:hypothetical protein diail_4817 [Diaporthe ilicicola]